MPAMAPPTPPPHGRWQPWQLFALAVLIWGTTWHAIVHQLAHMAPEWGVALRFALAGTLALAWGAARGQRWRMSRTEHARLALQGVFMYGLAYLCVYHAERHVPSGLVAVGYSASPLIMGLGSWALWRTPLTRRFLAGGVLGMAGVALIFAPELAGLGAHPRAGLGAAFTLGAVALSAVGSLAASRNATAGLPLWPAIGWGMWWSVPVSAAVALATAPAPAWPLPPAWWLSFVYLAVAGSVVAFGCYLLLQQRWGPGQASTVGVATPVLALAVSTVIEGWQPGLAALAGVALAVWGNALALGWGAKGRS